MLCFQSTIKTDITRYLPNQNIALLDIETDGLSHKNRLVLLGVLIHEKNAAESFFIQWFNDDGNSEQQIVDSFIKHYEKHKIDRLVTFNGNAFDLPFINAKLNFYNTGQLIEKAIHIDLLKVARQNKHFFNGEKLNLKSIEVTMGISRDDTISGKENIALYYQYLQTKSETIKAKLCLHNKEDILNMAPLLKMFDFLPHALVPFQYPALTFNHVNWFLVDHRILGNYLYITLKTNHLMPVKEYFVEENGLTFHCLNQTIELSIQVLAYSTVNLIVIDTNTLLGNPFEALADVDKQQYIVMYNNQWNTEGILRVIQNIILQRIPI